MSPKAKKLRDITVRVSLSASGALTIISLVAPHLPNVFDPRYTNRWLATLAISIIVASAAIVVILLKLNETFGEFGEQMVKAVRTNSHTQDHLRDITHTQTELRKTQTELQQMLDTASKTKESA